MRTKKMNKKRLLQKIIDFLINLQDEDKKKVGKRHPASNQQSGRKIKLKTIIITVLVIFMFLFVVRQIRGVSHFNWILDQFENAGTSIGIMDENNTRVEKEKKELIRVKEEEEKKEEDEKQAALEKAGKERISNLKAEVAEKYKKLSVFFQNGSENGWDAEKTNRSPEEFKKARKDFKLVIEQSVAELEKCEHKMEFRVRTALKDGRNMSKEIEEMKPKIGQYVLKGQKSITPAELAELDKLTERVKEISGYYLGESREWLISKFFREGKHWGIEADGCPCSFMVSELWQEIHRNGVAMDSTQALKYPMLVPLRLKLHMQEYRHILWKATIIEGADE
jgi:hypothetical protein